MSYACESMPKGRPGSRWWGEGGDSEGSGKEVMMG